MVVQIRDSVMRKGQLGTATAKSGPERSAKFSFWPKHSYLSIASCIIIVTDASSQASLGDLSISELRPSIFPTLYLGHTSSRDLAHDDFVFVIIIV